MGESLDPEHGRLSRFVRVLDVPPADTGAETAPAPIPAASAPGLPERFGEAAGDTGLRPVPVPPPAASAPRASLFDTRIQAVIGKEGHYSNDPADRGGETVWGITIAVARAFGYDGPMRAMPRAMAVEIYRRRFWVAPGYDKIEAIDPAVAVKLLDWGITSGPGVGSKALQRALNLLNREGALYPDIAVDGSAGALTRAALQAFVAARGREGRLVLLGMLAAQQSCFYMAIAETRPTNERFEYGWQLNRALAGIAQ